MNKTKEIFEKVLKEITPEEEPKEVKEVLYFINKEIKKQKIKATAMLGGSYAKNTWLKEDYDVDIFIKFDLKYQDLSNITEKILRKLKPERIHGSRDYFHYKKNKILFEIIPVLAIKKFSEAQNVTDFSPMHVAWVQKNSKKYINDIRLLKKFMKAQNVYGAENYIRGFSGHVVDLLIINYKGFINLLKASTKWKPKTIIDVNKIYKGKALFYLNKSKTEGPLILIDPIQKDRNASAALNEEKFFEFINAAKKFLKKPSANFFEEKKTDFEKIKKERIFAMLEANPLKGKNDVVGSKIVKVFEYIKKELEDFDVKKSGWEWKDKATLWYVLNKKELPKEYEQQGPPIKMKEAILNFKKKHKKTIVKNNKIYAVIKRNKTKLTEILKEIIAQEYVKERIKSIKLL